jgi:hypothetical protein
MDSTIRSEAAKLSAATAGFVLAAAIAVLFNTALAWAKDAYAPLKGLMKSLSGHDWTTQGLVDLLLFAGLGIIFTITRLAEKMDPNRLIRVLVGAVGIAGLGLALWYMIS